jgi:eukaryotic-like serine/threonine-protein kinase
MIKVRLFLPFFFVIFFTYSCIQEKEQVNVDVSNNTAINEENNKLAKIEKGFTNKTEINIEPDKTVILDASPVIDKLYNGPAMEITVVRANENRTGVYQTKGIRDIPEIKWNFKAESILRNSPAIAGGNLYLGSDDFYFYCIDLETGEKKWSKYVGAAVMSTPFYKDGIIYFDSAVQKLYACNAETGEDIWNIDTDNKIMAIHIIDENILYYCTNGSKITALKIPDREVLWDFDGDGSFTTDSMLFFENKIIYGTRKKYLYCLDKYNGNLIWSNDLEFGVRTSAVIYENIIIIAGANSVNNNEIGYCTSLNKENGKIEWNFKINDSENNKNYISSSPAIYDDKVYFGSGNSYFYALDANTGELVWQFKTQDSISSSPSIAEGIVYFGSHDGHLYALNTETGELKWKYYFGYKIFSSPVIMNGVVYITTADLKNEGFYLYALH